MTRAWWGVLGALAAVRVAVPLAALADSGHGLPGLPRYVYGYRGDASGYYSTARAILSGVPALGLWLAPLLLLLAAALWLALRAWRRGRRATGLVLAALALSVVAAAVILAGDRGAVGAVGWPLLWAVPMAPLRVLGVISMRNAFGFGLALSLAANVVTLVAAAYAGLWATRRRGAGLLAAALWALWPLYIGLVAGHGAWAKGAWEVDTGLSMNTEPLSTACCTATLALLLRPRQSAATATLAGIAAGYATLARPSNGLLALLAVAVVLVRRGLRGATPVVAGGLTAVPVYLAFLPKRYGYGFSTGKGGAFVGMSPHNIAKTFTESPLWGGRTLGALVPPALVGLAAVGRDAAVLLGGWVLLNTGFYALAPNTSWQPRYLFAALPALLVLWAAGAWTVGEAVAARRARA
ncbi:MAG TPA: hypothetical protein VFJ91_01190 [Gaiellaceae bacterium]|nr:hypothetical protein [Gaiellaceae bacterium]